MKRITFTADQARSSEEDETCVSGVASGDQYLIFQREVENAVSSEYLGPYLEYNDQSHGKSNWVKQCRITRSRLEIDLTEEVDSLPGIIGFDVDLDIEQEPYEELLVGLKRVFRGGQELVSEDA